MQTKDRLERVQGPRISLSPLSEDEIPAVAASIAGDPTAAPWWGADAAEVESDLRFADYERWAIEYDDERVGVLVFEDSRDKSYPFVSYDISLWGSGLGQGLGAEALRVASRWLARTRGHHHFLIDPAVENERAIRAYKQAGFREVGTLRRYERRDDGTFRDGLLMDLLAEEIPDEPGDKRGPGSPVY